LSVIFYNIFLCLFRAAIHTASLFNPKAKKWVIGRKNIFSRLDNTIPTNEKIIWFHCASLGEFEQGRPVIERMRSDFPSHKILLTFFSPSGYEVQKNYKGVNWVFYLPMDSARNARLFLEIVQPVLVVFVKYEFWYYYLKKIKYRNIPLILISALFRPDMSFFKWYGKLQRKMLSRFDHLFVQNETSLKLIEEIGLAAICSISGDTRFDRVLQIASKFEPLPLIEKFIGTQKSIVAGSTWPEDEVVLNEAFGILKGNSLKLIIAPHEINDKHLTEIISLFPNAVRYSQLNELESTLNADVLIIDNVGMLSKLYRYATIAYIGGGLKAAGVHNVLEAAVYGKPVLFGEFYKKYTEAIGLVNSKGGLSFTVDKKSGEKLGEVIEKLVNNQEEYNNRSEAAAIFVQSHAGASEKIIQFIQEKRLLTN
jgi:3-deoxy-D-manno-octulosonic-acid transferase